MPKREYTEGQRKSKARWYRKNKEYVKAQAKRRQNGLRRWLREYKSTAECDICRENHPACLEFHHRDPSRKEIDIVRCPGNGWSIERMLREIAKCRVLCSNCHRKLHSEI
jgi:hypothetical protein